MQGNTAKKKILFVITKGNFGGAQRYVYDLATSLSKDKFEAVVACGPAFAKATAGKAINSLSEMLKEKNIRTIVLENSEREINIKNDFKTFRNLIRIIKSEKPDAIHLNSSKIGLLGALVVLYLKIFQSFNLSIPKSIFTAHGWAFNEKQRSYLFRIMAYISQYLTVLICNTTIAVSEKAKRDIAFLPFIKNKIKVVYNGISNFKTLSKKEARVFISRQETPSTDSTNSLKSSSEQAKKTVVFSTSELHKNKGIDVALKALSLLPKETREKIIYSIAGSGEEKENLEKLISDLGIKKMVRFLGFVPDAKKLLSGTDIFLLPSRTEAFPYSLLEAGATGVPTIATSVGGIPEVIHDMQNGILIHPQNPKEIAEAILYLLDHKDKQKEFGSEIKKTISNFFSLEKMLSETISIYSPS